jgi:hypothetical protein
VAENWELKDLERRVGALEEQNHRRARRQLWWFSAIAWTVYVIALTTMIVLAATGTLHHH